MQLVYRACTGLTWCLSVFTLDVILCLLECPNRSIAIASGATPHHRTTEATSQTPLLLGQSITYGLRGNSDTMAARTRMNTMHVCVDTLLHWKWTSDPSPTDSILVDCMYVVTTFG